MPNLKCWSLVSYSLSNCSYPIIQNTCLYQNHSLTQSFMNLFQMNYLIISFYCTIQGSLQLGYNWPSPGLKWPAGQKIKTKWLAIWDRLFTFSSLCINQFEIIFRAVSYTIFDIIYITNIGLLWNFNGYLKSAAFKRILHVANPPFQTRL